MTHPTTRDQAHRPPKKLQAQMCLEHQQIREPTLHSAVTVAGRASSLGRARTDRQNSGSAPNATPRTSSQSIRVFRGYIT